MEQGGGHLVIYTRFSFTKPEENQSSEERKGKNPGGSKIRKKKTGGGEKKRFSTSRR